MAYLVITSEGLQPCRHELGEAPLTIGRAFDCEISIADGGLSRRHCRFERAGRTGKAWAVVDLNSSNGTRVGRTYVRQQVLVDGDEVFAGKVKIVFHAAGFVSKRSERPELPDAASPVLAELLTPTGGASGPRPMPRVPEPLGDAAQLGGLSDTAVFSAPSAAFERAPARPVVADVDTGRRRRIGITFAVIATVVALAGAAAAWVRWR